MKRARKGAQAAGQVSFLVLILLLLNCSFLGAENPSFLWLYEHQTIVDQLEGE